MSRLEELIEASRAEHQTRARHRDMEHQIQSACVRWFRLQYPHLAKRLFAVPNGGWREKATAGRMKAEGVLPGVADLILLKPNARWGALLIEMKTATGRQGLSQKEWQEDLCRSDEYKYVLCRSVDDFRREVMSYLREC